MVGKCREKYSPKNSSLWTSVEIEKERDQFWNRKLWIKQRPSLKTNRIDIIIIIIIKTFVNNKNINSEKVM
jgi:hypothetical protein